MNKKGIEGLPIKYAIIAIIAAIVLAVVLELTGVMEIGIGGAINQTKAALSSALNINWT